MQPSRSTFAALALVALSAFSRTACGDPGAVRNRSTAQLAEGVYAIQHEDGTDDFPQGNTTVIIGAREVMVIDSCYLPSSARADIAQIRAWTDKPVKYLVNTHWHNDHIGGNAAYLAAFPGLAILAHPQTREMMDLRIPGYVTRYIDEASAMAAQRRVLQAQVDGGTDESGKTLSVAERTEARNSLARYRNAVDEFKSFRYQSPTVTFESELKIDLGNREVRVRHPGRGNTGGDLIAYLPQEKILVTGDLLDHPVPYAFGGYPSEWAATLGRLAGLDIVAIVPGHGGVLRDKTHLRRVARLISRVVEGVNALLATRGSAATVEEARNAIDLSEFRQAMAGDDKESAEFFDASMASLVRIAFNEARQR